MTKVIEVESLLVRTMPDTSCSLNLKLQAPPVFKADFFYLLQSPRAEALHRLQPKTRRPLAMQEAVPLESLGCTVAAVAPQDDQENPDRF